MLVANVTSNFDKLTAADISASTAVVDQLTTGAIENKEVWYNKIVQLLILLFICHNDVLINLYSDLTFFISLYSYHSTTLSCGGTLINNVKCGSKVYYQLCTKVSIGHAKL